MKKVLTDIRRGDVVKIKNNMTDADIERVQTFAQHISKEPEMYNYAGNFTEELIDNVSSSRVWKCGQTKKGTDYVFLCSKCDEENHVIYVPIQSRYLVLVHRKPSHPLTNIFQEKMSKNRKRN